MKKNVIKKNVIKKVIKIKGRFLLNELKTQSLQSQSSQPTATIVELIAVIAVMHCLVVFISCCKVIVWVNNDSWSPIQGYVSLNYIIHNMKNFMKALCKHQIIKSIGRLRPRLLSGKWAIMYGRYTPDIRRTYGRHTADIWRMVGGHTAPGGHTADIRQTYGEHAPKMVADIRRAYGGHTT